MSGCPGCWRMARQADSTLHDFAHRHSLNPSGPTIASERGGIDHLWNWPAALPSRNRCASPAAAYLKAHHP
ncbi:MAG: hypothetical protein R3F40_10400 [Candidatus Competibacteraceae bacterium]